MLRAILVFMVATWMLTAALLAATVDEPLVGPPAPAPVVRPAGAEFIGPPVLAISRPAPEQFWMLESASLRPQAPTPRSNDASSTRFGLDEALAQPETATAEPPSSALLVPRVRMDRLSGLDDVVSGLEDLELSRPGDHGFRVTYTSDCGSSFRSGYVYGWSARCRP